MSHIPHTLRIGILMGGKSLEREVSFLSGRTICDHIDTMRYTAIPLFQTYTDLYLLPWHFLHRGKIADFEHRLAREAKKIIWDDLKSYVDFIYIAQHGRYGEDGVLQGMLEMFGIPYLGSGVLASAIRADKIIQKKFFASAGIKTPRYVVASPAEIENFEHTRAIIMERITHAHCGNSWVIKPYNEGSSLGVSVISCIDDLGHALRYACFIEQGHKKRVLIEERIVGMEFTCIVIMDNTTGEFLPLAPTEVVYSTQTPFCDYEQKYMPGRGEKITPARCSDEITKKIQDTCIAVMKLFDFATIGRIDGFVDCNNEIVIIDANSLSGMAPSSFIFNQAACSGMSPADIINHLLESECIRYGISNVDQNNNTIHCMNTKQKINVAVLLGGASHEKEISLESGRNVVYKLSPQHYNPIPLFVSSTLELYRITQKQLVHHSTQEIERSLMASQKVTWTDLPTIADFVFIALHGGHGENGCVQGMIEMLRLPYNGSSIFTSALCMNKKKTADFLAMHTFHVPQHILVSCNEWLSGGDELCVRITSRIPFPLIIKPHDDGCSVMVQKVNNNEQLSAAFTTIFASGKHYALVEEFIAGIELTVGVIGNDTPQVLPPSHVVTSHAILSMEEKFLPGAGENQTPAPLESTVLQLVMKTMQEVYKAVQCKGYARIDCFYQSSLVSPTQTDRIVILEINTLPALTPATCLFHQAAEIGLRPMEFIDTIITLGFQEHAHTTSHIRAKNIIQNQKELL